MGASPTCQVVPNNEINIIDVTMSDVVIHKKVGNFSFLIPGNIRKKLKNIVIIKMYITTLLISSMADVLFGSLYKMGPLSELPKPAPTTLPLLIPPLLLPTKSIGFSRLQDTELDLTLEHCPSGISPVLSAVVVGVAVVLRKR